MPSLANREMRQLLNVRVTNRDGPWLALDGHGFRRLSEKANGKQRAVESADDESAEGASAARDMSQRGSNRHASVCVNSRSNFEEPYGSRNLQSLRLLQVCKRALLIEQILKDAGAFQESCSMQEDN